MNTAQYFNLKFKKSIVLVIESALLGFIVGACLIAKPVSDRDETESRFLNRTQSMSYSDYKKEFKEELKEEWPSIKKYLREEVFTQENLKETAQSFGEYANSDPKTR